MHIDNLFEDIPADLPDEFLQKIVENDAVRLERIVSRGHCSPAGFWYDQPRDEWVVLLKGGAGLEFENRAEAVTLKPGDHLLIPARARHRVTWTDPNQDTIWLAVHFGKASAG